MVMAEDTALSKAKLLGLDGREEKWHNKRAHLCEAVSHRDIPGK
jgi:hypothetical protein